MEAGVFSTRMYARGRQQGVEYLQYFVEFENIRYF